MTCSTGSVLQPNKVQHGLSPTFGVEPNGDPRLARQVGFSNWLPLAPLVWFQMDLNCVRAIAIFVGFSPPSISKYFEREHTKRNPAARGTAWPSLPPGPAKAVTVLAIDSRRMPCSWGLCDQRGLLTRHVCFTVPRPRTAIRDTSGKKRTKAFQNARARCLVRKRASLHIFGGGRRKPAGPCRSYPSVRVFITSRQANTH